ncbi:Cyclin-A2 [Portunus trituberculatus]|uniref:Cyclin-A2 n=1 Tax=Portunus trituberculatus TaxID=210409 RepID=A0A5B7FHN7_PORTR|nr:Cyclin-A2 [Portunus trituberculatus]
MASGWLWQGSSELPTHCVFHYPNAPPVSLQPSCYSHVSSDNTYNYTASYGFASVAPSYSMYSTQCMKVAFVKPRVQGDQHQAEKSRAAANYSLPVQPPGPGPGTGATSDPDPPSQHITVQPPTVILVAQSATGLKRHATLPEQDCDNVPAKSLYTHAKRICRIRPRPRQSQHASAEQTVRRMPTLRGGLGQHRLQECAVQDRWVVVARPKRVTKRVSGAKTPHPYQRRRKTLIQRHLLQIPALCLAQEVMTYLLEVEKRHLRTRNYLTAHPSVSQRTRAILVDWLIQVQSYLGMSRETLYQAVAMVDRVLEECCIPVQRVQLLAVTCLLIASKIEEQQPVQTAELLHLTLNSYKHGELLALERRVLQVLNFNLTYADPTVFLCYFLYLTCNTEDQTVNDCCGFLMEVVMVESWPLETRPSLLAAAALHGALMVVYGTLAASAVPLLMPKYFNLKEEDIVATSLRLLEALTNRFNLPFQGAESKYASESRHCALARHPRLQPLHLVSVVDKVRASLINLRGENTVIRSSQHGWCQNPPWCLTAAASVPAGNALQQSVITPVKEQSFSNYKEDDSILVPRMEEG